MTSLKIALLVTPTAFLATLIGQAGETVVTIAAVLAGVAYMIRVARLAVKFLHRWIGAVQVIHGLAARMEGINKQLASGAKRFDALDERLDRLEHAAVELREPAEALARELDVPHRHPYAP